MSNNQQLYDRAQKVLFQNYRTQPIALLRGEGTQVWDADGKRYLDFIGGIATVSVGHANPRVRAALEELVACKDLKEKAARLHAQRPWPQEAENATNEYERRQPLAWKAARAALQESR